MARQRGRRTVDSAGIVGWFILALDAAGNPGSALRWFDGNLKFAWRDGAGWQERDGGLGRKGRVVHVLALVLPAIPDRHWDQTNGDLKFAWRDGAGWQNETVDSAGMVGWFTSLALGAAGNPRISCTGWFE